MMTKFMFAKTLLLLAAFVACQARKDVASEGTAGSPDRPQTKRSLAGFLGDAGFGGSLGTSPWAAAGSRGLSSNFGGWNAGAGDPWNLYTSARYGGAPSPSEVANAIAAAKQASANVLIAQQQMQAAKEHVLNQQRIAMDKEAAATLLTQKSEAAAAIQRSEAASAAQGVVLAQQRLAASKQALAHQQRIAASREADAASALQRSAHAAAAEIQKTEHEASKFGQYTRNGNAGAAHYLTFTKDQSFVPIVAGTNHVPGFGVGAILGPWAGGGVGGKPTAPVAGWL